MNTFCKIIVTVLLFGCSGKTITAQSPVKKKIDKMLGADISFLPELESRGKKFYENGTQRDAIEIL